ncbi:MAG: HU family DNA-binding protein [Proteobacteria bacterium]|nr:HU family DNA-binding protein [Pseudomonadota bacterium]MBU0966722.1 HU family DNA-binding protein [Pseudomonadota bacterium]
MVLLSEQWYGFSDENISQIQTGGRMNKGELVEKVAKDCDVSKAAAEKALDSVLAAISDAVAAGDKVTLIGFGTFSVTERAAREGRNPQTGKKIKIAARKVVKFKAGSKLADAAK